MIGGKYKRAILIIDDEMLSEEWGMFDEQITYLAKCIYCGYALLFDSLTIKGKGKGPV